MEVGHSRIPIYLGTDRNAIIGTLLVKQLLLNDVDHETSFSSLKLRRLPRVCSDTPLVEMLHLFEAGASHLALVVDELSSNTQALDNAKSLGIVTLEDVIEELIGEEVLYQINVDH